MEKEFKDIKFKYSFRDYQQNTLDLLDKYKNDEKIHIVAAPGAGKTILALELLIRIGNKALILAPTIAIKEQWIERLRKDFANGDKEKLISTDLESPSIITIITYQSLYSLNRKKVNIENIINENNIRTIVLDEAHHLRKIWFKTLKDIVDNLKNCTTISLTATPPYDNGNDFANYMSLCGDIDARITVPQLVKNKCLCAHQDLIYFNVPNNKQDEKMQKFQEQIDDFINDLKKNENFIKTIALHDYIINTEEHINDILDEFDFYISALSFLTDVECEYPINQFNRDIKVPKFNKELMQIILEKIFFGKETLEKEIFKETFKGIKEKLNILGCIDGKTISLKYTKELSDILLKNSGKIDSIQKVIETEYESLKEKLKLVVITDFIKEDYYDVQDNEDINEVGVIPIFKKIILSNIKVAVLTGSIIIIPTELNQNFIEIAQKEYGISEDQIEISELGIDFNYSKVILYGKAKTYSVNSITKLFQNTDISVLIGTVALIGEGWDAPFVNSLIMATFVSSYVTANQVRGRAIRINKADLQKVANIWHLICLEKENEHYILGQDYEILSKRFLVYEGINLENNTIKNGIERLNVENKKYTRNEIVELNNKMIMNSQNRYNALNVWHNALENYIDTCNEIIPKEKIYRNKTGKFLGFYQKTLFKRLCKSIYLCLIEKEKIDSNIQYYVKTNFKNIEYGLKNANIYEQSIFIKYIKQAMQLDKNSRYIIKTSKNAYTVPEIFSKNKTDAMKFFRKFRRGKLIYTKSEEGKRILLECKMKEFKKKIKRG